MATERGKEYKGSLSRDRAVLIVIQSHELLYPVSIDCREGFSIDFKQVQVPWDLKGIKGTVTVWKEQCMNCGETGYVTPMWYTRISQSYLNAVPSKDAKEKTRLF